jgi:hypothetical protein
LAASYPPLPDELVTFTEGGLSLLVATCSAELVPDCVRACGVRVWPGACQLTVLIPAATGAASIANLKSNPRLAMTLAHIPSHRTVQIKGTVTAVRDGTAEDRAHAEHYRARFAEALAWVGQLTSLTSRLSVWPLHAVDLDIAVVFAQTPGPTAGAKMPLERT